MALSYPFKNLPNSVQALFRPMLVISLTVHGLLLAAPMPEPESPPLTKKETVKVTQLPPVAKPAGKTAPKSPAPAPKTPATKPPIRRTVPTPAKATPVNPLPKAKTPPSTPSPPPSDTKATKANQANATEAKASDSSSAPSTAEQSTEHPFADFPHYPGATPGCFGKQSCWQTKDNFNPVAAYFQKQLPAQGFEIVPDIDESERKVYQVSKEGTTQYLNVFSREGTVYVLAPEPLELAQLEEAIEVPGELYLVLGKLGAATANDTDFQEPKNFYAQLSSEDSDGSLLSAEIRPEIDGNPKLVAGKSTAVVFESMKSQLTSNGFTVAKSGSYGGGELYKLQKEKFTGYLNLVPSQNRQGTLLVLWTQNPS